MRNMKCPRNEIVGCISLDRPCIVQRGSYNGKYSSCSTLYFGQKYEFTGEKALLEEHMYTTELHLQQTVLSPRPGSQMKIADFLFPRSILFHMNWHSGSIDSAGSYRGEYFVDDAYDLNGVYGPVVDLDSAIDTGMLETKGRALRLKSMTPYNQHAWVHNENIHYRHHRIRQRFYLIARVLARRLYHENMLELVQFQGISISMGLIEYADSIAKFALLYCEFDSQFLEIPVPNIDFSSWKPKKWDMFQ